MRLGVTCTFGRMTRVFYVPLRKHGGGTDTEKVSAHKVNSGEENSPAAPAGVRTRNLSIRSPALLPTSYPGSVTCRKHNQPLFLTLEGTKARPALLISHTWLEVLSQLSTEQEKSKE